MILATQCLALLAAPALGCDSPLLAVLDHQVPTAAAQRGSRGGGARAGRGGGGGGGARAGGARAGGGARASAGGMNRPAATARSPGNVRATSNGSINRSASANRNTNRNVNRNTNVNNINVHGGGGYYGGGGCYGCGWDSGGFGAGMVMGTMTGAMIGAAAASNNSTTVVYQTGTVATSLPSGCTSVVVNGASYQQCGSVWYQPRYSGTTVEYVVVDQP